MKIVADSVSEYIEQLPDDRKTALEKLRRVLLKNLPVGFEEIMAYNMPCYVVPHSIYPQGYHVNPKLPLMLVSVASQKNFVALYHMGLYGDPALLNWFVTEYAKLGIGKLDMGKSCIRFKKLDKIPYDLIGELATKMSPSDWITCYEKSRARN